MASVQVGGDHIVAEIIHVTIFREDTNPDANSAFSATINGPGFTEKFSIHNGAVKTYNLTGVHIAGLPVNPSILVEVDDFALVPPGVPVISATALRFNLVFKLVEIFKIQIGLIPVTASLK